MPGGDGRGPNGAGPMTGRGAGFCSGNSMPGYANAGRGRGASGSGSWVCRGGRGWRNRFYATGRPFYGRGFQGAPNSFRNDPMYQQNSFSAEEELKSLKEQAEYINERIKELESASSGKTE